MMVDLRKNLREAQMLAVVDAAQACADSINHDDWTEMIALDKTLKVLQDDWGYWGAGGHRPIGVEPMKDDGGQQAITEAVLEATATADRVANGYLRELMTARAEERETCAKVAEDIGPIHNNVAAAIRARGKP